MPVYPHKYRKGRNERMKERRALGLCPKCGEPPVPGMVQCQKHREQNNRSFTKRYHERKNPGHNPGSFVS